MRWVNRGPEPAGVDGYARDFTQGWIDYFQNTIGERPTDSNWREFRPLLGIRTNDTCWYCERRCYANAEHGGRTPTVDHFRPISRFPELAYEWSNWIFSCQRCNGENKRDGWPATGYVDPCALDVSERPELYFDFDADTGEIAPKTDLAGAARDKAYNTIRDLGLNQLDVMFYRRIWTLKFISDVLELPVSERQAFIEFMTGEVPYAGTTRIVVDQLRQDGHI